MKKITTRSSETFVEFKLSRMLEVVYQIKAMKRYGISNVTEQGWELMDYHNLPTRQRRVVWFVVDSMKQEERG